jgi:hypothetical protein
LFEQTRGTKESDEEEDEPEELFFIFTVDVINHGSGA